MSTLAYAASTNASSTPSATASTSPSPLLAAFEQVNKTGEAVVVEQQGQPAVVMMTLKEYESIQETAYVLGTFVNAKHLLKSIEQLQKGEVIVKNIEELERQTWRESVKQVIQTHYKTLEALKDK